MVPLLLFLSIQQIVIDGLRSDKFYRHFGLPKGSCLGPLLFSIYTSSLFEIVTKHLPSVHCYADDTELYLAFRPDDRATQDSAVVAMEACIQDVRKWMITDELKIDDGKAEFTLIGTRAQLKKVDIGKRTVGDSLIYQQGCNKKSSMWMFPALQYTGCHDL